MRRVLVFVVLAMMLAACSGKAPGPAGVSAPPRPLAQVSTLPGDKATGVSPTLPVAVRVTGGMLQQVALTNSEGKAVAGTLSADQLSWLSTEPLGYGKTYTWSGSAVGPDHLTAPVTGSFTTVEPRQQLHATLNIADGDTVGIGAPIILQFDGHVSDKAAVERALQVQASVPTVGSWGWEPDDNGGSRAHYRTEDYWQPDTQVSVTAKLYGVALGKGSYGMQDISTKFTIGRSQIVKADINSHRMIVIRDGQEVMNFPASYGLSSDPNRNTTSGVHVVMTKAQTVLMSNPAYGYNNVPEHWAVRISNNGEFIHANPETTGVQGSSNVTHGCVNLSTANAQEYYATAIFGDPVEVTGSPSQLTGADGDIYDWTVPWDAWLAMSALHA
ncbi:MAG: Ig-like domain-containing protein [Pseudonocardiaceae bacterium]